MDLQQLSTFCAIVLEKNMTTTAQRLKVTQPTVSRQIKLLENELGVDLIERGERVLRPTLQGQLFFEYAQKILNLVQKAQRAVQSLPVDLEGQVRVTTLNYLGMSLMAPVVYHFLKPHHPFKIQLYYAGFQEIIEKMKKKEVDIALLPDLQKEYGLDIPFYKSRLLFQDPVLFAGSRKDSHFLEKIHFQDIGRKPVVSFANMFPRFNLYLEEKKKEYHFQWEPVFEVNNLGTLKKMIEMGIYRGFMPAFSIRKQLQFGRLSAIQVEKFNYSMDIRIYYLSDFKNQQLMDMMYLLLKKQAI